MEQKIKQYTLGLSSEFQPGISTNKWSDENREKELMEEELNTLDVTEIERFWEGLINEYGGFLPELERGNWQDFLQQFGEFSLSQIFQGFAAFAFHELSVNGRLVGLLIMLTIFSMFLQSLQNAFEKSTVAKIAYAVVFMVLIIIALNSFQVVITYATETVQKIIDFTLAIVPLLLALVATSGGVVSASFFHPVIVFLANTSGIFVKTIILPMLFLSTLLSIISTLTEHYKLTQLAGLLRNWSIGLLGIFMTVFLSVVSLQGTMTAVADGVAIRTAKFVTGNFIPVVGRMFTDATDTVISASIVLKNSIGIAGVILLLLITLFPVIKILVIAFIYKFSAAILQPLGGGPIITCLDVISKCIFYLFAAVGIVAIMFFLSLTIIILAGNLTMMVR